MAPKPGSPPCPGSSMEDTYLPSMRGPAFRRHDSYPGFRTELESLVGDDKGKSTSGRTTRLKVPMYQPESHCSIIARKRSNVRRAKGAGHPRQEGVNGQPEELLPWRKPGGASSGWHEPDESRDSRPDLWEARGEIPWAYPARSPASHGGLTRARSWKRRIQPKKAYSSWVSSTRSARLHPLADSTTQRTRRTGDCC